MELIADTSAAVRRAACVGQMPTMPNRERVGKRG
jgi:hypothetical protein